MLELFLSESYGDVECKPNNGYSLGKKWLSVNVEMWKEDLQKGNVFLWELYEDDDIPSWWLDKVFKKIDPRQRIPPWDR